MKEYAVHYEGYYIIEAENEKEALASDREDETVKYEEWENLYAELLDD